MKDHFEEEHLEEENDFMETLPPRSPPRIFEGKWEEHIPSGFDTVIISLDGRFQADLDWKKGREQAQKAVEKGYSLMWNMQLGLFDELAQPLTNQTQFLALTLSLEYFRDSLWKEFKDQTIGITLIRGNVDFSLGFPWNSHQEQNLKEWLKEIQEIPGFERHDISSLDLFQLQHHQEGQHLIRLFCRDVAIEYLALLATRLPDSLPAYLYLDATSLAGSYISEIQLLNPERFDRLYLALKGHRLPFEALGWEVPSAYGYSGDSSIELPLLSPVSIGVCIPSMTFYHSAHYQELEFGLNALHKRSIPFKLISESQLTSKWDGLDYLLYTPSGLTTQGKRMLQGFCAAGGMAVSVGNLVGLSNEISLMDWFAKVRFTPLRKMI